MHRIVFPGNVVAVSSAPPFILQQNLACSQEKWPVWQIPCYLMLLVCFAAGKNTVWYHSPVDWHCEIYDDVYIPTWSHVQQTDLKANHHIIFLPPYVFLDIGRPIYAISHPHPRPFHASSPSLRPRSLSGCRGVRWWPTIGYKTWEISSNNLTNRTKTSARTRISIQSPSG